jgi:phosphatidyl-myo-inositol dimannoside synthase
MRVLWVTNDLPPRAGGIQQFIANLLARVHPDETVVIGPAAGPEAVEHDAAQPYRTVRRPGAVLPTRATRRAIVEVARAHDAQVIVLGATWPLGELAPALGRALGVPIVALSHGLEAGLARPGVGHLIRRATRGLDAVTAITAWTEGRLAPYVRAERLERLPPGVDVERFTPHVDGRAQRQAWGVPSDATLVGCISRLVPRKGQDALIEVWPEVRRSHPDAWLALVGEGPLEQRLRRAVGRLGPGSHVVMPGRVPWPDLPASYAALDVFAMPCRTRLAGTDVEGLGIVYLEAQACGVPAIAGRSGGAPEAVRDGVSGSVVDGRDPEQLFAALDRWLSDPAGRRRAGEAGGGWARERWSWPAIADRFATLLADVTTPGSAGDRRPRGGGPRR